MNVNYKNFYKEIKKSYLMFFLSIVALTVIAQAGFQFVIHSQANFSNVINIAGRQRMLSQRIARFSNQLVTSRSLVVGNLLKDTVSLFKTSHQDLMNGNAENQISKPFTDEIQKNYYTLDPIVNNLTKSATCIIENCERTNDSLLYINNNADKFLKLMNETVFLSSAYAKTFVDMLSYAELAFFTLILLVMGIELFILLAPFNKRLIEILEKKDVEESSKQKLYHLAEIGEISAEISHEVNNITAIISGNTALLSKTIEKTTNDEKSIEYIRKISSNLKKIVNIHKSMGRLSRINLQGEFVPEQIKDDVLELLEHMIQKQNINFEFNINYNEIIISNRAQVSQVLVNLIKNSIHALDGCMEKTISVEVSSRKEGVVSFYVCDNGAGIPDGLKRKVTDAFFTTKDEGEGTGLGLSISKKIANALGGDLVLVDSKLSTTFELSIKNQAKIAKRAG